jgi:hypothetical protein
VIRSFSPEPLTFDGSVRTEFQRRASARAGVGNSVRTEFVFDSFQNEFPQAVRNSEGGHRESGQAGTETGWTETDQTETDQTETDNDKSLVALAGRHSSGWNLSTIAYSS